MDRGADKPTKPPKPTKPSSVQIVGMLPQSGAMSRTVAPAGIAFLVLDALDEERASFYRNLGFVSLPSQPLRMVNSSATMRAAMG